VKLPLTGNTSLITLSSLMGILVYSSAKKIEESVGLEATAATT